MDYRREIVEMLNAIQSEKIAIYLELYQIYKDHGGKADELQGKDSWFA